jgi:hypothetical protein
MAQAALGALELLRDDLAQARVLLRQCRDTARRIGAPGTLAVTACMQGFAARAAADVTAASKQFRFALRGGHAIGDSFIMTYSLEGLAWAARVQGNPARAAHPLGAAEGLRAVIGSPIVTGLQAGQKTTLQAELGLRASRQARAAGRRQPLAAVITTALAWSAPAARA